MAFKTLCLPPKPSTHQEPSPMTNLFKNALGGLFFALLAVAFVGSSSILASAQPQGDTASPEITDVECSFYLDRDGDGEGNERFDALPDEFIPQETPMVGDCTFTLNAPTKASIVFYSELQNWAVSVVLKKEPTGPVEYKVNREDNEISDISGEMSIAAHLRGNSPRSVQVRNLADGYRQEVQIPHDFRLLEVRVVTGDGRHDRLERNVQTASAAYIQAHSQLAKHESELQDWATHLAQEWLDKGYPQVADSITRKAPTGPIGDDGISGWMVATIATWVLLLAIAVVLSIIAIRNRR